MQQPMPTEIEAFSRNWHQAIESHLEQLPEDRSAPSYHSELDGAADLGVMSTKLGYSSSTYRRLIDRKASWGGETSESETVVNTEGCVPDPLALPPKSARRRSIEPLQRYQLVDEVITRDDIPILSSPGRLRRPNRGTKFPSYI